MQNIENDKTLERYKLVHDYSKEVWNEMLNKCFTSLLKVDKLPLYISEKLLGKNGEKYTLGRVSKVEISGDKIVVIEISINPNIEIEEIKRVIIHELLHFGLMVSDLKSEDNSAIFNLLCEAFGISYSIDSMPDEELKIYNEFREVFINRFNQICDISTATKLNIFISLLGDKEGKCYDIAKNFLWDI